MTPLVPVVSFGVALRRALRRRCPACGLGRIFRSVLRLAKSCPACGWIVEREPGAVTGSMYLIAVLTQLFAVLLLILSWLLVGWSPWAKLAAGLPLIALFSIAMLPWSRAVWAAIEFWTDVRSGDAEQPEYARRAFAHDGESPAPPGAGPNVPIRDD